MNENLGVLQEPTSLLLTGTITTDVLTMVAGSKFLYTAVLANFVNEDSTDRTVTLYRTVDSTDYAIYIGTCGAGQSLEIPILVKMYAKSTARKIRAKASAGNVVTVTISYYQGTQQADASQSGSGS
jgi:hypothetical protein